MSSFCHSCTKSRAEIPYLLRCLCLHYRTNYNTDGFKLPIQISSYCIQSTLKNRNMKGGGKNIAEISHIIHFLVFPVKTVDFGWIPSHCGICDNKHVDKLAKQGATYSKDSEVIHIPLSPWEWYYLLEDLCWIHFSSGGCSDDEKDDDDDYPPPYHLSCCQYQH